MPRQPSPAVGTSSKAAAATAPPKDANRHAASISNGRGDKGLDPQVVGWREAAFAAARDNAAEAQQSQAALGHRWHRSRRVENAEPTADLPDKDVVIRPAEAELSSRQSHYRRRPRCLIRSRPWTASADHSEPSKTPWRA